MKIKYQFADEIVEIEVADEWGEVLVDLDREEYNANHRETRRHCSLEAYNLGDALLPSDEDVQQEVLDGIEAQQLQDAIAKLEPYQQELIRAIFFEGMTVSAYAERVGITQSAATHRKSTAINNLKKFLK